MSENHSLFDKSGGYRKLYSFTFATMIQLETIRFCKRFIPWQEDQLGKTAGQMIGAARSGRQNIIEGSERSATSKETEIKLTDVARASLMELLGDYEMFLGERRSIPWSDNSPEKKKLKMVNIREFQLKANVMNEYWKYYWSVRPSFSEWFDSDDPVIVANALLALIERTTSMLAAQLKHLGDTFISGGGFRERMYSARTSEKDKVETNNEFNENAPACPDCGKPMRLRNAKQGNNSGGRFWGCSAYPKCRGTREVTK